jgi:hypothetical protein
VIFSTGHRETVTAVAPGPMADAGSGGRPPAGGARRPPSPRARGQARSPGASAYRTTLAPVPEKEAVGAPEFNIMAQEAETSAMLQYTASLPKRGNAVASLLQDLRTVLRAQDGLLGSCKVRPRHALPRRVDPPCRVHPLRPL